MMITGKRRGFLRGVGGILIGLPLLEALQPRAARAATAPRRFAAFLMANGIIPDSWYPTGGGTEFTLPGALAPLEPFKSDCVFISGVQMSGRGGSHTGAPPVFLTGHQSVSGINGWKKTAAVASMDQVIAKRIGRDTKVESLQLGVLMDAMHEKSDNCISYKGAGQPMPPQDDPYKVYAALFSDLSPIGDLTVGRTRALRISVLDMVDRNCAVMRGKISSLDRSRVDAYCTAVREVERKLDMTQLPGGRCEFPELATTKLDHRARDNYALVLTLQLDLMAMAFACDITRVATFMVSSGCGIDHGPWLPGAKGSHHGISHSADADPTKLDLMKEKMTLISTWYYQRFAYFLERLKAISEPDGRTVLDNSVILHSNEYGHNLPPDSHHHKNLPIVVAGGGGGTLRTGTYLNFLAGGIPSGKESGRFHNRVLTSCINAVGIPTENWGDNRADASGTRSAQLGGANFGELEGLRRG